MVEYTELCCNDISAVREGSEDVSADREKLLSLFQILITNHMGTYLSHNLAGFQLGSYSLARRAEVKLSGFYHSHDWGDSFCE